jgi:hypothetical protein
MNCEKLTFARDLLIKGRSGTGFDETDTQSFWDREERGKSVRINIAK